VVIEAFRHGAANAQRAGSDGVEIRGANGHLLDQFLQDATNKRADRYGGAIENRARLMLEVADAVVSVWGAGRVGMHLAPRADAHDMGDSDLRTTFASVAREGAASPFSARARRWRSIGPAVPRHPDLRHRFALKAPLNPWNTATFYAEGPRGYTDYPMRADAAE
jgi:2,4-dienoyl-CoA reductase-like NADH-dependent reductase (Old Yellow Enzyme family)